MRAAAEARLFESFKFELDVRSSLHEKQLQAVREEMASTLSTTEKKWVALTTKVEASVESRFEAERKLHKVTEEKVHMLRDAAAQAHAETIEMVGGMQETAVDHNNVSPPRLCDSLIDK